MADSSSTSLSKQEKDHYYPVSESFRVLEGYDVYRSPKLIIALVVVESESGKDLRLYRWQKRGDAWKVDLCRMSVSGWRWEEISQKAKEFISKYELGKKGGQQ